MTRSTTPPRRMPIRQVPSRARICAARQVMTLAKSRAAGGSWNCVGNCRCSDRGTGGQADRDLGFGFRPSRTP